MHFITSNSENLVFSRFASISATKAESDVGVLYCALSKTSVKSSAGTLNSLLQFALQGREADIYFCNNHDIVICWNGDIPAVTAALRKLLSEKYHAELEIFDLTKIFVGFVSATQNEALLAYLKRQLKIETPAVMASNEPAQTENAAKNIATFSPSDIDHIKLRGRERRTLPQPTILIVEDQAFSRKLLRDMLSRTYICYEAANAAEAIASYAENVPCIVFLDIELPDTSGHALAALFKKHDPAIHIVMVTANNYTSDVQTAKANGVEGFIAKPYNKQKIYDAIKLYSQPKNSARSGHK